MHLVGGMKRILCVLIIGLLFLSACSRGTITARPVDEQIIDVEVNVKSDLCEAIECNEDSYCVSGKCVCRDDLKMCNGKCIAKNLCCSSGDCDLGEFCENNICIRHVCPFNQIYDPKKERCVCDADSNLCSAQSKCIPRSSCCIHADCGNDRACALTYFVASVCVDDGRVRCRSVIEGQNAYFTINGKSYDVEVTSVSRDFVSLKINDLELEAQPVNVPYELTGYAKVYVESSRSAGGVCKEV